MTKADIVHAVYTRLGGFSKKESADLVDKLERAVADSAARIQSVIKNELSKSELTKLHVTTEKELRKGLKSKKWKATVPGRSILKRFTNSVVKGFVGYEALRELIVSNMREKGFEPPGMKSVIDSILNGKS